MAITTPEHPHVGRQTAGQNLYSRRTLLRDATAATISLAGLSRLQRASAQMPAAHTALGDLQQRLNGTLLLPKDSAFPSTNTPANHRYQDVIPKAIARCADEADVITCVQWCLEHGEAPVVRGGGHSYAGFSTTSGLLIDLRDLNSVSIDPNTATLTAGGAATNANLLATLKGGPHFLPGGICPTVGVGGLTLGGGIGYNTRWAGLTCDHLQHTRVVTAKAEPLDVSSGQHDDLFWALRGGAGGSFGVNTSFTFDLVDVPSDLMTNFSIQWRGADAAGLILLAFQELMHYAPDEFGALVALNTADPEGGNHRRSIKVFLEGHFIGSQADLRDLLEPILSLKTSPTETFIEEMNFWDSQQRLIEPAAEPHAFTDISRYATAPLPQDAIEKIVELLVGCPHRTERAHGVFALFGWVGGVLTQTPRDATAYVHRDMTTIFRPGAVWPADAPASVSDELLAWTEQVAAVIASYTPDESYQNFPNRAITDWQQQYFAENFPRLVSVKAKYDPQNLFQNAQSIPLP